MVSYWKLAIYLNNLFISFVSIVPFSVILNFELNISASLLFSSRGKISFPLFTIFGIFVELMIVKVPELPIFSDDAVANVELITVIIQDVAVLAHLKHLVIVELIIVKFP